MSNARPDPVTRNSDGSGTITVDGQTLASGTLAFENTYKDEATGNTIVKLNGGNSLAIIKAGTADRIIVNDWSEAKSLGITLQGSAPNDAYGVAANDCRHDLERIAA
jgi:hypothetical protein